MEDWEKLFNPDLLKQNLIQCSLFITGYEILKDTVINRLQSFYSNDFFLNEKTGGLEYTITKQYKNKVLSLYPKDQFHAGCIWFKNNGAIEEDDLSIIQNIRKHRNYVTHEIAKIISSAKHSIDHNLINDLHKIVRKIEYWWIKEIEVQINSDVSPDDINEINPQNTFGGNTILLHFLLSVFDGDESYLRKTYHKFYKAFNSNQS